MEFSKGHGIGNDFVLVADPDNKIHLSPQQIQKVCDRHQGIGGDGYIRATQAKNIPDFRGFGVEPQQWFMDYWNADGTSAQMCGNGVRVFVQFLIHKNLVDLSVGSSLTIGTRAGQKIVNRIDAHYYSVDMGPWSFKSEDLVAEDGYDSTINLPIAEQFQEFPAVSVNMGNPHTAARMDKVEILKQINLESAPRVNPVPPDGTNAEFYVVTDDSAQPAQVQMRVHERGVGETQACGTGACAVAVVARKDVLDSSPQAAENYSQWDISLPGGTLRAEFVPRDGQENIILSGPAEIVADGTTTLV